MEEDLTAAGGGDDNLYVIKSLHNNKFSYQKEVEFGLELHTRYFLRVHKTKVFGSGGKIHVIIVRNYSVTALFRLNDRTLCVITSLKILNLQFATAAVHLRTVPPFFSDTRGKYTVGDTVTLSKHGTTRSTYAVS